MMRRIALVAAALATLVMAGAAQAADHEVKMLNKGAKGAMVFEPDLIRVAVGDTVTFVPTDKSHDAESVKGMAPAGTTPFKGKISQPVTVTIDAEGVYGVKCTPHYGMGMVALIVAGNPVNLDEAKAVKHPGKAKKTFEALLAEAAATP